MRKFLIIDTFNFLHRAYHALPATFRDQNGEPTNAVYGFTSMLINVLNQIKPQYMVAALESERPTFRVEDFTAYKAHRKPMEDGLMVQIPKCLEILDAFGIKQIQVEGYEADDVIGTLVKKFSDGIETVIVSNDRDMWQLATNSNIVIMYPGKKGEMEWIGAKEADARFGFDAHKIPDYKGLRGDPSDNIPGVFGIGEKTATNLIQKYGSVEEIYKNIGRVEPESLRKKLTENYEQALMSKKLAQIITDVPVTVSLGECKYSDFNRGAVKNVLQKYNFKSLIRRLGFEDESSKKSSEPPANQLNLL
jgi:DNA polymerase-1